MADFRIGTRVRSKISGDYGRVTDLDPASPNLVYVELYGDSTEGRYPNWSGWLRKDQVSRLRKGSKMKRKASVAQSLARDVERKRYGVGKYSMENSSRKKNPTKAERTVARQKASAKRRVADALASYLKKVNPAVKLAGAQVEHLKGGVLKITPIKANRAKGCKR